MKILRLHFSRAESPELVHAEFSANGQKTLHTVRGQSVLDSNYDGTFNWSGAVRALAILVVRTKACSLDPGALPSKVLSGERGSPATSLDYAISKEPNWLLDMFGFDSKGDSLTKRLFRKTNSGGKRPGPVSVALNESFLDCKDIAIYLDGAELTSTEELIRLERNLVAQAARSGSTSPSDDSRPESAPVRHVLNPSANNSPRSTELSPHWVILGAGRIGRGFLNIIADELGYTTTLVVAGRKTPSYVADEYNNRCERNKGYEVKVNGPERTGAAIVRLSNYRFQLAFRSDGILERIADPNTKIVSTSVGIERITEIAPLLAEGIRLRLERDPKSTLVLLVCENGRFPDGRTPREMLLAMVRKYLGRHLHSLVREQIDFPEVVLDCAIPALPTSPSMQLQRGWGQIVIERSHRASELFSRSEYIELVNDVSTIHRLKLYSFNSLHCYVSVLGSFLGYHFVHEVVRDPRIRPMVDKLASSLAKAILTQNDRGGEKDRLETSATSNAHPGDTWTPEKVHEYCTHAVDRLVVASAEYQDPVERVARRLLDGSYFHDGRIDGPLLDLGLDQNPSEDPALVRMLSLCLFFILKTHEMHPSLFASRSLYFDKLSELPEIRDILQGEDTTTHLRRSVLHGSAAGEHAPALAVICDDLAYLESRMPGSEKHTMTVEELVEFFHRDIALASPRRRSLDRFDLRCAVFDLDEGLINSEALLYRVTREMIDEFSTVSKSAFSHDDYARFVGMSEREFFAREVIPRFQFSLTSPEELIQMRQNRYLELLSKTDPESLCKPGFRATLTLLRRCGARLALYSNASRGRVDYTLSHLELRNYFDVVVSSSDEGMEDKPSPRMLRHVFSVLGVQPEQCLVVESSKIGIDAAKAAGCYCIAMENNYYPRHQSTIQESGVEFLGNGWQLLEWLKTLIRRGANVGDLSSMKGPERSDWLKDVFETRFA